MVLLFNTLAFDSVRMFSMALISEGRCCACRGWTDEAISLSAEHMVLIIRTAHSPTPGSHQATEGRNHGVPEPYYNMPCYSIQQLYILC